MAGIRRRHVDSRGSRPMTLTTGFRSSLTLSSVVLVLLIGSLESAQLATIPEQLARAGQSLASGASMPSGLPPFVDDVLMDTDVVVRGTVTQPQSYLSEDQLQVYTDYVIANPTFLYPSTLVVSKTPGVQTIKVTMIGGTVRINGLTFTSDHAALPLLASGAECLFLLKKVANRYHIAGIYYGVFRIDKERVTPETRQEGFAPEYSGISVTNAASAILERLATLRR